jgi:predicted pyridoxine 5'-phosphate oxidase superfamily flavin-nucleotide-binding protein
MMTEDIRIAMDWIYPAAIATCSAKGIPNVTTISQVWYVDDQHVALSHQFFNKTKANLKDNPNAVVRVIGIKGRMWELHVRYLRTETSGSTYDHMAMKLKAIASFMGMEEVFRLVGADVYEVLQVRECTEYWDEGDPE